MGVRGEDAHLFPHAHFVESARETRHSIFLLPSFQSPLPVWPIDRAEGGKVNQMRHKEGPSRLRFRWRSCAGTAALAVAIAFTLTAVLTESAQAQRFYAAGRSTPCALRVLANLRGPFLDSASGAVASWYMSACFSLTRRFEGHRSSLVFLTR